MRENAKYWMACTSTMSHTNSHVSICVVMTYDYLCAAYENSTNDLSEGITEGKVPSVRLLAPY
jgi:hypothetical protein